MNRREMRRREVEWKELEAILERTREGALNAEEHGKLRAAVDTLGFLTRELESKGTSIDRLRRLLFGPSTEKTSRVLRDVFEGHAAAGGEAGATGSPSKEASAVKPHGHGRHGVEAYWGAKKVPVPHASLTHGAGCPECGRGKVYLQNEPASLLRITGMAPLQASVFELERLRCNACGQVFSAEPPPGVGTAKYDESATAMIGLLRYGCGLPFNRLEKLEGSLGIPLPAATQWELVAGGAKALEPVHEELIRQAAQGEVFYNDDTTMKVLELMKSSNREVMPGIRTDLVGETEADPDVEAVGRPEPEKDPKERTGIFTSGIVSRTGEHRMALFFTGRKHAGENLEQVLKRRAEELSPPIQMCDALSRNTSGDFETIVGSCLVHARRNFVQVADRFPDECRYVFETLRAVYRNDALARERKMGTEERLAFHRDQSGPIMEKLRTWGREQFEEHLVEPNSGLGDAISYMEKHWDKLTLFLRKPGAPLDNTICERSSEARHCAPQELPLLQDAERRPGGGPLHEPDPHGRAQRGRSLPLSRRCSPTPPRDGRQPLRLDALELSRRTGHQRAGDRPAGVARLLSFHAPPPCHPGPRHATGRRRPGQSQRNPGNRRAYAPVPKGHGGTKRPTTS